MTPAAKAIIERAHRIARERRKVAARVDDLKRLAERTAAAYDEAVVHSGLPPEHFRLRAMLFGMLPQPPRKLLQPPPRNENGCGDGETN
jgi:hypothetical protein